MAIVRELITLLGTEVDTKGFQQYEKGIARVKELAIGVGKLFGVVFAADKIIEFADGLITAGKEINKLGAQLKVIARPFDDMGEAQDRVFETAQRLGLEYKEVLGTFKEFYNEMRETTIPVQQIETATENIYKTLQVGRASAEGMQQTMDLFNRSFRRGGMRSVGVGMLQDIAPRTFDVLAERLDKLRLKGESNEEMLRRLAKAGKLTAEVIIGAFGQANKQLDEEWEKVPQKIDKAFVKIYNDLANVTARIYKLTDASVFMGRVVWAVWSFLRNGVKSFVDALGGLEKAIELVGIALAVAFGPWLIRTLAFATTATLRWAAASWGAALPWIAIGAAILAAVVLIQDLMRWSQNKESWVGTWLGPYKDLGKNFEKMDIFSGMRGIWKAVTLDFEGFVKEWDIFVKDTPAQVLLVTEAILGIGVIFWAILPAINGVIRAIRAIVPAAEEAAAATTAIDAAAGGGKGKAGKGPRGRRKGFFGTIGRLTPWAIGAYLGLTLGTNEIQSEEDEQAEIARLRKLQGTKGGPPAPVTTAPTTIPSAADKRKAFDDWVSRNFGYLLPGMGKTGEAIGGPQPSANWLDMLPGADTFKKVGNLGLVRNADGTLSTPGGGGLAMAPGAFGPPPAPAGDTNIQPVFNQTNSIKVETVLDAAQIGAIIGDKVGQYANERFGAFARDIQTSAPRIEAATQ